MLVIPRYGNRARRLRLRYKRLGPGGVLTIPIKEKCNFN